MNEVSQSVLLISRSYRGELARVLLRDLLRLFLLLFVHVSQGQAWDFVGQVGFISLHRLFLARLVLTLRRTLDAKLEVVDAVHLAVDGI